MLIIAGPTFFLQIYDDELENADGFERFEDCFRIFKLYRGKKTTAILDEQKRFAGIFKVQRHFLNCDTHPVDEI